MVSWHDTPWMWLSMVAFWALFAAFAYYAFRGLTRRGTAERRPEVFDVLEQRYARGEITTEQYREQRETLAATGMQRSEP